MPSEILKISSDAPERQVVDYAANYIVRGGVVAVPTDTFYGLSADPFNLAAIGRVYEIKGRPESKALPILVSSVEQAVSLVRDVPDSFLTLANKFWPGALTIVLEATHRIPLKVTGNTGRVALRWANSKVACEIINAVGGPITGTSANLTGMPACTNAADLIIQLGDRLPLILDSGDTRAVVPSTIVRLEGDEWMIIREGAIAENDIQKTLAA
ncbi:MAG: L-threonylcarbamoyladenylate synthase [Candidatus Acidiferrales bacterium]